MFVCLFVCLLYAATRTNTQTHTAFHAVAALQRHAEEERRQLELLARNDPAKLAEIAKLDTLLGEVLLSGKLTRVGRVLVVRRARMHSCACALVWRGQGTFGADSGGFVLNMVRDRSVLLHFAFRFVQCDDWSSSENEKWIWIKRLGEVLE